MVSQIKSHPQYKQIVQDLLKGSISPQKSMTLEAIAKRYSIGKTLNAGVVALKRFKRKDLYGEVAAAKVMKQELGRIAPSTTVDDMLVTYVETGRYAANEAIKAKDFGSVVGLMEQGLNVIAATARNRGRSIDPLPQGIDHNDRPMIGGSIQITNLLATPKTGDGRVKRVNGSGPVFDEAPMLEDPVEVERLPEGFTLGQ